MPRKSASFFSDRGLTMDATAALGLAGTTLASYFAIMNPISSTPVFIAWPWLLASSWP